MKKIILSSAALAFLWFTPAHAMDAMTCDEASITKMQTSLDALKDPSMKSNTDMAMKHLDMAKTSMKDKKMDDCSAQLGMAQMSMNMKCDDASMAMMKTQMDAATDPAMKANKDEAMKNMDMAKTSMTAKKTDECMAHMGAAMDAMHKKM